MVLLIGNRDGRNGNRGLVKQEQQTSDRQNSGLSKPNSE